jgi:hypothetical protein
MADENTELDLSDADAEKLLADPDTEQPDPAKPEKAAESATDATDWKAEAERWKKLSRQNEATAKQRAEALKKYEDANKSEAERLQEERDSHKTRAEKAETALKCREIAEERAPEHATVAQIKAVARRLSGDTDEALEKDADELFALIAPTPPTAKTPQKPKERLRGGSEPDADVEETDPRKLAALSPRRR